MDAHLYGDGQCQAIFDAAAKIQAALTDQQTPAILVPRRSSDTLITKIMLGVFGCVPAFDTYFKRGFGVSKFTPGALRRVGEFYAENAEAIERHRVHTLEFDSARDSQRKYTRAKVIDMVFFTAARLGR
jgi:hypothetical protein